MVLNPVLLERNQFFMKVDVRGLAISALVATYLVQFQHL